MIRFEAVVTQVHGIAAADLRDWIARGWIAPVGDPPDWQFAEPDIARVRLVRDLHQDAGVAEDTLALVLSLLDQIADLRHSLPTVLDTVADLPPALRAELLNRPRR